MHKIVVKPLEEGYQIINLRCSMADKFNQCAYSYQNGTVSQKLQETFDYGTMVHKIIQEYLLGPTEEKYSYLLSKYSDPQYRAKEHLDLCIQNELPQLLDIELELDIQIEFGKYLICLSGHMDGLFYSDNYLPKIDIKTSKAEWKPGDGESRLQHRLYAYIYNAMNGTLNDTHGIEDYGTEIFEYWVFTKHVRGVRFQKVQCEVDLKAAERELVRLAVAFAHANEHGFNSTPNKYCNACSLKNTTCPIYSGLSLSDMSEVGNTFSLSFTSQR